MPNIVDTPTYIRTTSSATRARIARIIRLIKALRVSTLSTFDICDLLDVSPSGSRKYTVGLAAAKIVFVTKLPAEDGVKRSKAGAKVSHYNLVDDECLVEKYIVDLNNTLPSDATARIAKDDRKSAFGHHIYRMTHDVEFRVRPGKHHVPAREPLMAALFGPATVK